MTTALKFRSGLSDVRQPEGLHATVTLRRYARSRCVRIIIRPDATVLVTAPRRVSLRYVEQLVRDRIDWIRNTIRALPRIEKPTAIQKAALKRKTRALVSAWVEKYCAIYGVTCGRISVRDQRSRWGSCSSKGNMNFNYRLASMPEDLAEYVVVHEVCHLVEMNHSPQFWRLVARTVPDYQLRRKLLRRWSLTDQLQQE